MIQNLPKFANLVDRLSQVKPQHERGPRVRFTIQSTLRNVTWQSTCNRLNSRTGKQYGQLYQVAEEPWFDFIKPRRMERCALYFVITTELAKGPLVSRVGHCKWLIEACPLYWQKLTLCFSFSKVNEVFAVSHWKVNVVYHLAALTCSSLHVWAVQRINNLTKFRLLQHIDRPFGPLLPQIRE